MAYTPPTPSRDAIVQVSRNEGPWVKVDALGTVSLDTGSDNVLADVFQPRLVELMDSMCLWESMDAGASYRLVWSGDGSAVRGVCPVCDDIFPVSDGLPGDELNEGYEAVCCGCDPRDSDD